MRAFENHLAKEYPHIRPTSDDAEFAWQNWKAALRFVLEHCSGQTEDLRDDIIEELYE